MGLMFARRRADAKKQVAVNKAKAHAENHKLAHANEAKRQAARQAEQLAAEIHEPKTESQPKAAPTDAIKPGTK